MVPYTTASPVILLQREWSKHIKEDNDNVHDYVAMISYHLYMFRIKFNLSAHLASGTWSCIYMNILSLKLNSIQIHFRE